MGCCFLFKNSYLELKSELGCTEDPKPSSWSRDMLISFEAAAADIEICRFGMAPFSPTESLLLYYGAALVAIRFLLLVAL